MSDRRISEQALVRREIMHEGGFSEGASGPIPAQRIAGDAPLWRRVIENVRNLVSMPANLPSEEMLVLRDRDLLD